MVVVAGTVRLAPGALERARPHMERMIAASRAEAGCQVYSYATDVQDPTILRIFEVWDSQTHLDAHFQTDHIKAWRVVWTEIGVSERNLKRYTVSNATPL